MSCFFALFNIDDMWLLKETFLFNQNYFGGEIFIKHKEDSTFVIKILKKN